MGLHMHFLCGWKNTESIAPGRLSRLTQVSAAVALFLFLLMGTVRVVVTRKRVWLGARFSKNMWKPAGHAPELSTSMLMRKRHEAG